MGTINARFSIVVIVAWSVVLGCQMVRALFPLLVFNPSYSTTSIAIKWMAIFVSPILIPLLLKWRFPHHLFGVVITGLVFSRIAMQIVASPELLLLFATLGTICALITCMPISLPQALTAKFLLSA